MTTITLALNDAEQQALHQILDTALRQGGLSALDLASHFVMRISAAQGAAAQPQRAASAGNTQAQPCLPQVRLPQRPPALKLLLVSRLQLIQ